MIASTLIPIRAFLQLHGDARRRFRCREGGHPMPERCKQCEKYEKSLKDLRERRRNLWRRGELTDATAEELSSEEQRIIAELKEHQAMHHKHSIPM